MFFAFMQAREDRDSNHKGATAVYARVIYLYFYTVLYKQQREVTTFWVFKVLFKFPEMY